MIKVGLEIISADFKVVIVREVLGDKLGARLYAVSGWIKDLVLESGVAADEVAADGLDLDFVGRVVKHRLGPRS